ncbi:MAG: M15 family metallopeptidase [Gemmatimonadaceae bacterium]|nr:M15 family metallopeptidase [Gemmatimonadaceae bacterium]
MLAPAMRRAVEYTLEECTARGIDAIVHETYREHATAVAYYKRGRTQKPPLVRVTNAPDETWSWHGYGLGVDIISRAKGWNVGRTWHAMVAEIAKRHGLKSGIDWTSPDLPHHQWGRCKATPSDEARRILREQGLPAVWRAVGADEP